ncbi:MAG: 30S ribosome-binding factor RbfA [Balneolaceae bacterium]|nr:30S ribosome-binding factor RbfA [Balneolaceae bacterium]MDR9446215.1 30S ribosome-binding factor RbfA [Balneolaceae bacterium]
MGIRPQRVAGQIQQDLGEILQQDFQPAGCFVSITHVLMTDDLSIAKVYLSIFAPKRDENEILETIDQAQDAIRHTLAQKIRHQVRRVPELIFFLDDTAKKAEEIETLFQKVGPIPPPEDEENTNDDGEIDETTSSQ